MGRRVCPKNKIDPEPMSQLEPISLKIAMSNLLVEPLYKLKGHMNALKRTTAAKRDMAMKHASATHWLNVVLTELQHHTSDGSLVLLDQLVSVAKRLKKVRRQIGNQYPCGDLTIARELLKSLRKESISKKNCSKAE